jgi:DNA polymerase III subunit delta
MPKKEIPSIYDIAKFIKPDKLLPVYFFCGEDGFTIDNAVKAVDKACAPYIKNDFDREVINLEKGTSFSNIIDLALGFPFGDGKKIIIAKNFNNIKDKAKLKDYLEHPAAFTVLVITHPDKISDPEKDPYKSLFEKGYIFEARTLDGAELAGWLVKHAKRSGLILSHENAKTLVEIVGEEKGLLEMHIQKFSDFLGQGEEVTYDTIKKLSSSTKEYSIFDLQDAMAAGNKARAVEIGFNLLDCGKEIIFIIAMLAKFIKTISQATEVMRDQTNDFQASRTLKISYQYYLGCKKARFFMNYEALARSAEALLNADTAVKTTSTDPKTILLVLITEMLGQS